MNSPAPTTPVSPAKTALVAQMIALDLIQPDPNQPRKLFDEAALQSLASSIKAEGLVQPVVVRPNGKGFYLVAGERRLRACKLAGLKEAPAIVRSDLKDQDVHVLQLVENVQREDLSLPEQCEAVAKLVKQVGSAKVAADKLGRSEAWVSKRATAVALPDVVKQALGRGAIVDLELAHGIGELHAESKASAEKMIERLEGKREHWRPKPDRKVIREEVQNVKARKKMAATAAKTRAKATKKAKGGAAEPPEAARARINAQLKTFHEAAKTTQLKAETALCGLFKVAAPKHNWNLRDAISIGFRELQYYGQANFRVPTTLDAFAFGIHVQDNVAVAKKIMAAAGAKSKVRVELPDLSIEQVEKLSAALPGVKVEFDLQVETNGKGLAKFIQRVTPGQKPFELVQPLSQKTTPAGPPKKKR